MQTKKKKKKPAAPAHNEGGPPVVKPHDPPPLTVPQSKPVSKKAKAKDKKKDEENDLDKALEELSIKCVMSVQLFPLIVSCDSPGIQIFDKLRRVPLPTHEQPSFLPFSPSPCLTLTPSLSSKSSLAPKPSRLPRLPRLPQKDVVAYNHRHSVLNLLARNRPGA